MEFTREEIEAKIAEIKGLEKTAKPHEKDHLFVRRQIWTSRLVNAKQGRPVIVSETEHEEMIEIKPTEIRPKTKKGGKHAN
jgi:hypothetical protein